MCSFEFRRFSLVAWVACAFVTINAAGALAAEKEVERTNDDLEAIRMGLIFNPVVRHTDSGHPVTLRQQTIINMAKKIVEIRRETGDDEENLRVRAKAIVELEAKKKAVADRIAADEKIVTKNFVIPGTTPQESRQIHAQSSGLRVADAGNDASRAQYVVNGNLFDDNESQTCALGENCLGAQSEKESKQLQVTESGGEVQTQTKALSTFQDVTVKKKRISREEAKKLARERGAGIAEIRSQAARPRIETDKQSEKNLKVFGRSSPNAPDVQEPAARIDDTEENLTAEEIYRRYFPDASLSPAKTWRRFLDGVFSVFAGPASALEPQDSASSEAPRSGFTREDLLAIKKATEAAKKEGVEAAREVLKNCEGCGENQEIAPVQFSEIQKRNQQRARQLLTGAEAVKKLLKPADGSEVEAVSNEQNERTIYVRRKRPQKRQCPHSRPKQT